MFEKKLIRTKKIVTVVVHNPSSINPTTRLRSKPILTTIDLTSIESIWVNMGQVSRFESHSWICAWPSTVVVVFFSQVFAIAFQFTRRITAMFKFAKLDWWGLSDYDEIFCKKDKLITSKKAKKKVLRSWKKRLNKSWAWRQQTVVK